MEFVNPNQRITKDLELTEEVIFSGIALNPDKTAEQIRQSYDLNQEKMSAVTNTLISEGYIEPIQNPENDLVWKVTELGQLILLKYVNTLKFDIMEAQLKQQSVDDVNNLKKKKKFLENAYKQSKALFKEEEENQ